MSMRAILSPLRYIEAGRTAAANEEFNALTTPEELYRCFLSFCTFMREQLFEVAMVNKHGIDVSRRFSIPLIIENFWLYGGLQRGDWEKLAAEPDTAGMCSLISDAINGQQLEGAMLGLYMPKMVQIVQQRAEKIENTVGLNLEQITGMQVL